MESNMFINQSGTLVEELQFKHSAEKSAFLVDIINKLRATSTPGFYNYLQHCMLVKETQIRIYYFKQLK